MRKNPYVIALGMFIIIVIGSFILGPMLGNTSKPIQESNEVNPEDCVVLIYVSGGLGSGVVISPDGIILTAGHMVKNSFFEEILAPISIVFADGTEYTEFECIYVDEHVDVAYFKIKNVKNLPYLKFGDLHAMDIGNDIWAIGMPFGLEWWYSYGYISKEPNSGILYMDISLNPGNSGCPILNDKNEIVGICTSGYLPGNDISLGHTSNICEAIFNQYRWLFNLHE